VTTLRYENKLLYLVTLGHVFYSSPCYCYSQVPYPSWRTWCSAITHSIEERERDTGMKGAVLIFKELWPPIDTGTLGLSVNCLSSNEVKGEARMVSRWRCIKGQSWSVEGTISVLERIRSGYRPEYKFRNLPLNWSARRKDISNHQEINCIWIILIVQSFYIRSIKVTDLKGISHY
jgi:hypothetical protein